MVRVKVLPVFARLQTLLNTAWLCQPDCEKRHAPQRQLVKHRRSLISNDHTRSASVAGAESGTRFDLTRVQLINFGIMGNPTCARYNEIGRS